MKKGKIQREGEVEVEYITYPTGKFKAKGEYHIFKLDKTELFEVVVEVSDSDYDYDSAFVEEQESLVVQRKVAEKLGYGQNEIDLEVAEWEQAE